MFTIFVNLHIFCWYGNKLILNFEFEFMRAKTYEWNQFLTVLKYEVFCWDILSTLIYSTDDHFVCQPLVADDIVVYA